MNLSRIFSSLVGAAVCCGYSFVLASGEEITEKSINSAFECTVAKLPVKPGEKTVKVEWSFTNKWDFPLAVEGIESPCGCLAGQIGMKVVEPGKSGRIEASFQPGAYRGIIRKSIHVRFVNFKQSVELVMEAHIPSPVELSTNEVFWIEGKTATTQTIEVKSGTGTPFAITDLLGVSVELFTITKETLTEGAGYRLSITPVGKPISGTYILQVRTNSPDPRDQVLAVFLQIRPSGSPPQTAAAP